MSRKMTVKQEKNTNKFKKQYKYCLLLCKPNLCESRGKEKIIGEMVFPELPGSTVSSLLEFVVVVNRISMKVLIIFIGFNNNNRLISNYLF